MTAGTPHLTESHLFVTGCSDDELVLWTFDRKRDAFAWAWTGRSLVVWSGVEDEESMRGGFELAL